MTAKQYFTKKLNEMLSTKLRREKKMADLISKIQKLCSQLNSNTDEAENHIIMEYIEGYSKQFNKLYETENHDYEV